MILFYKTEDKNIMVKKELTLEEKIEKRGRSAKKQVKIELVLLIILTAAIVIIKRRNMGSSIGYIINFSGV